MNSTLWRWLIIILTGILGLVQAISTLQQFAEPSVRLIIPSIDVNTTVAEFPLGVETWEIDAWETQVGHFEGTAWIDRPGNIVLGGHTEYPDGSPAVFNNLGKLRAGNSVKLAIDDTIRTYRVIETKSVASDDLSVLYPTENDQLTLITCDEATYDAASHEYSQRVVVIAAYQP